MIRRGGCWQNPTDSSSYGNTLLQHPENQFFYGAGPNDMFPLGPNPYMLPNFVAPPYGWPLDQPSYTATATSTNHHTNPSNYMNLPLQTQVESGGGGILPQSTPAPVQPSSPDSDKSEGSRGSALASGHVRLWQFLEEMLRSGEYTGLIEWTRAQELEFRLIDPDRVAALWGERKNKPKMNYEKMSRSLRYYYDKKILKKVVGQRYVYQFMKDRHLIDA